MIVWLSNSKSAISYQGLANHLPVLIMFHSNVSARMEAMTTAKNQMMEMKKQRDAQRSARGNSPKAGDISSSIDKESINDASLDED